MIIGVGSWRGIGASTVALSLTSAMSSLGHRPWLIEADPAGGTLAARLALDPSDSGGLERIAFPTNHGAVIERFEQAATEVAGTRIITAPGDSFRAWACHTPRIAWAAMLGELDGPVVVDLGRLRAGSPLSAVLTHVDQVVVVTNPDVVALLATIEWADALGRASPLDAGLPLDLTRVAIVDSPIVTERVSRTDTEAELGDRFVGWLPWSPSAIELIHRGARFDDRRMRRQPLVQAAQHMVELLESILGDEAAA